MESDAQSDTHHPRLSEHERELAVFQVTEKAKANIVKWLQMAAAIVVIVLSLLGLKAYTDYQSALATIDAKVAESVRSEVAEYRKFTDQIIAEVVNAKTRTKEFSNEMNVLEKRIARLRDEQQSFFDELTGLEGQAREKYKAFEQTILEFRASPSMAAALSKEQADFIERGEAFAKKIGLNVGAPPILFEPLVPRGMTAKYDTERQSYVIDPQWIGEKGVYAEAIAVSARFMLLHFERAAFGEEGGASGSFWISFKHSLISYLIEANATELKYPFRDDSRPLYRFLKKLAENTDDSTATKFAVTLVTSFDPFWTYETLPEVLTDLNMKNNLVNEEHFAESVKVFRTTDQ